MSAESNIILITNQESVTNILKTKLILLREIDNILTTPYSSAIQNIKKVIPDIVLIYCSENKEECLELIRTIKSDEEIKNISILLIVNDYEQDFILSAYDENITDYTTLKADDAEILMRTIWCLKKNMLVTTITKQERLFEKLGVIDSATGFYSNEYSEKIFENEFVALKKLKSEGILMLVSASEESKTRLNPLELAKAINKSIRNSDVVVHGSANRFYILLSEIYMKGAFCVWEKIKQIIGNEYTLKAGVSVVGDKSFQELKIELLNALIEAESTKQDLVIVNQEEKPASDDWLDKINSTQKNFKLFKQAFTKKLDKVITPVFYQMQKLYEEKLFKTKIEQSSTSTLSTFILRKADNTSELKITYPGFSKINIDIIHQGLDSPENKRLSLDLADLDESKLTKILENFIQEFKASTDE